MADAFSCQCRQWPGKPCEARMTQEDLLCDACRAGCSLITIAGQPPFHSRVTSFSYRIPPAGGGGRRGLPHHG